MAVIINITDYLPGASPDDWLHFDVMLGLTADLLPVVSNLKATVSAASKIQGIGKVPSIYNGAGDVVGLARWTEKQSTREEIEKWEQQRDYGICIQTRRVRALDLDITDETLALQVRAFLADLKWPRRFRSNSTKCLFAFQLEGQFAKRVLKTAQGNIEFLANGQQFVAVGTHPSGVRYEWDGGLPDFFPALDAEQFEALWVALVERFAVEPAIEAHASTKAGTLAAAKHSDPLAQHLVEHDWVLGEGKDGRLHVRCPFAAEHTTDSGETQTVYWPAHTGGFTQGNFKCLHAHCERRTQDEFREGVGYAEDDFEVLTEESAPAEAPFRVRPAAEFARGKPPAWIVRGVVPQAEIMMIYGESGSGKSFFALDLFAAVARGGEWRGKRVKQGRVVYIAAEGVGGFRNRLRAYAIHHKIAIEDLDVGVVAEAPNFMRSPDIKALIAALNAHGRVDVVIVDTLAQVTPGANENAGEDMGRALAHCKAIHRATGALVVLIHHSGKDATKGARGWSGVKAGVDAEIEIVRAERDRVATISKLKDGEDGDEYGFRLLQVPVGVNEDDEIVTSCVVEYTSGKVRRKGLALGGIEQAVWQVVLDLHGLDGSAPTTDEVCTEYVNRTPHDPQTKRDVRRQNAQRALTTLAARGKVVVADNYIKLQEGTNM